MIFIIGVLDSRIGGCTFLWKLWGPILKNLPGGSRVAMHEFMSGITTGIATVGVHRSLLATTRRAQHP